MYFPRSAPSAAGCSTTRGLREEHSRIQVAELPDLFALVVEYRMWRCNCPKCGGNTRAQRPEHLSDVPFGTKLQAFVSMLCSTYRMSHRMATRFMDDLFGVRMSVGAVQDTCERASEAVASAVEAVASDVTAAPVVNMDETGWKQKGKTAWVWNATTPDAELFNISPSRGAVGLAGVLPESYSGMVCTDRWGVYRRFPDENRQVCHANLRRDFQALIDRGGDAKPIGEKLLKLSDTLFKSWHAFRRGEIDRRKLDLRTRGVRIHWGRSVSVALECTDKKARALGKYMDRHWWSLWNFLYKEGVEPTNNEAERSLRKVVIWRKSSFGTQSEAGSKFVGRMMTVAGTARRRNIDFFAWLTKACEAAQLGHPAPLLISC
jgi:transposase